MIILNLILRYYKGCFARIWIFCPSIRLDPQFKPLVEYLEKMCDQKREPLIFEEFDAAKVGQILEVVAPAGMEPWPQITSVLPRFTAFRISGTSPPGPQRCGSTTCRVKAVATAASKALPPFSRMPMPTAVAIQCVEVTTPKVPTISGRVVKGLGLISLTGDLLAALREETLGPAALGG